MSSISASNYQPASWGGQNSGSNDFADILLPTGSASSTSGDPTVIFGADLVDNANGYNNESPPEIPKPLSGNSGINSVFDNNQSYSSMDGMNRSYAGNSYGFPYSMGAGNGFGSMYGSGFGSMYGGGYGGMYPNNMGNNNVGSSTQATFQLIESLIGAVAGFAQMLESTYMATHNSFFTLISIAEQFRYLKDVLGSALGIFTVMKFLKKILYVITKGKLGLPPTSKRLLNSKSRLMVDEFEKFQSGNNQQGKRPRIAWKPFLFFIISAVGFPFVLNKLIAKIEINQKKNLTDSIDFSKLIFARAMFDFTPENPNVEVMLKKGELMAIISKKDPSGNDSEWWKVRTKSGQIGYVPGNYLEIIERKNKIENIQE
ncbi:hypothetical protein Kpol_530p18 [Vanderwaltozyma polyspora DSM 70294]|uniref:Peroxisomal membrane protein PEX13 n=1 Tax=Vanderwaltozyma polyspora (strain ATCC 22028 / DSM 70294 / BCRC 21397 / CBS 2163 / NBRC 10782 / NRRL Y-8283 / UCD 57-17) TaxID=436907 RepID=A7TKZ2_VANPO|nr:uncharacterized protein Kpol_530p18 [Vanderwaltozyma polyspora DSM 70294]EDO17048.1 hypothetical protein Kpol_530p18 [Vanderwaltozyma polyspora DSM 70294]